MRAPLEERMLRLAEEFANLWSTCHVKHGAVLARGNRILSVGYNGSPPGEPHCIDVGCTFKRGHCVATIHAEDNAIRWAKELTEESTFPDTVLYVTGTPCPDCQELIERARIPKVVFRIPYRNVVPKSRTVKYIEWGWGGSKES